MTDCTCSSWQIALWLAGNCMQLALWHRNACRTPLVASYAVCACLFLLSQHTLLAWQACTHITSRRDDTCTAKAVPNPGCTAQSFQGLVGVFRPSLVT